MYWYLLASVEDYRVGKSLLEEYEVDECARNRPIGGINASNTSFSGCVHPGHLGWSATEIKQFEDSWKSVCFESNKVCFLIDQIKLSYCFHFSS